MSQNTNTSIESLLQSLKDELILHYDNGKKEINANFETKFESGILQNYLVTHVVMSRQDSNSQIYF